MVDLVKVVGPSVSSPGLGIGPRKEGFLLEAFVAIIPHLDIFVLLVGHVGGLKKKCGMRACVLVDQRETQS